MNFDNDTESETLLDLYDIDQASLISLIRITINISCEDRPGLFAKNASYYATM